MKITIFILLFVGCILLFSRFAGLRRLRRLLQVTRSGIDDAARKRLLYKRQKLEELKEKHALWYRLEQELDYTGIRRRFPYLTVEWFLTLELGIISGLFLVMFFLVGMVFACVFCLLFLGTEYLLFGYAKMKELRKVNGELLKLLDFLGNYSITSGEISSVFLQVSRYVDEPLRSALETCCYEAQTTGDMGAAMLAMGEKVEHPKFKELVRNMEITNRYCADFSILVNSSRRSMREYLRLAGERKGMLREATINMLLLLLLSFISLLTVDKLLADSVWLILWNTWPGRMALGVIAFIFLLFGSKLVGLNR